MAIFGYTSGRLGSIYRHDGISERASQVVIFVGGSHMSLARSGR